VIPLSEVITEGSAFIETKCCITHKGVSFCSGGSFLVQRKDNGKYEGLLYAYEKTGEVGSWDGSIKIKALFLNEWISNFGDTRQIVYFKYQDKLFSRIYFKSGSDIVRAKEVKGNIKGYYRKRCITEILRE